MSRTLYFRYLALMLILTASFIPIIDNNLPPGIGSYRYFWAPLWIISILIFSPNVLLNKNLLHLLSYGFFIILILLNTVWSELREWDRNLIVNEFFIIFIPMSLIWYFIMQKDYKSLSFLIKWALIFIGITAIMSIVSSIVDPLYARNMLGEVYDSIEKEYFSKLGGGNYSFACAIIGIFPILIYYYRNPQFNIFPKKAILIYGIICYIAVIRMQIFANILIASLAIILSILGRKNIKRSLFIIGFIFIIAILIPKAFYSNVLIELSMYFNPDSETFNKLNDMAIFLIKTDYVTSGTGARAARYPLLINAFLTDPVWGYYATRNTYDISSGGHIYWMNRLTVLGLMGFIPYIIIHFLHIKTTTKYFNKEFTLYFLISIFSIIILGLLKNISGRQLWFMYFFIIPGLYYLTKIEQYEKKN